VIPAVLEAAVRATGLGPGSLIIEQRSETPHQTNRLYDVWADGRQLIAIEYLSNVDLDALRLVESMDIAPRPLFLIRRWGRWWSTHTWMARCGTGAYQRPRSW
jgi:hypothetical protein